MNLSLEKTNAYPTLDSNLEELQYRLKNKIGGIGKDLRKQLMRSKMGVYRQKGNNFNNLQPLELIQSRTGVPELIASEMVGIL
ncbi:MAG: hypothetical protein ACI9QC_000793 [Oceanicoccus sp.]|jgi:hypothetical protein